MEEDMWGHPDSRTLRNGIIYEYRHSIIMNEHRFRCPDGTVITFTHEDSEGSVTIKEGVDG